MFTVSRLEVPTAYESDTCGVPAFSSCDLQAACRPSRTQHTASQRETHLPVRSALEKHVNHDPALTISADWGLKRPTPSGNKHSGSDKDARRLLPTESRASDCVRRRCATRHPIVAESRHHQTETRYCQTRHVYVAINCLREHHEPDPSRSQPRAPPPIWLRDNSRRLTHHVIHRRKCH